MSLITTAIEDPSNPSIPTLPLRYATPPSLTTLLFDLTEAVTDRASLHPTIESSLSLRRSSLASRRSVPPNSLLSTICLLSTLSLRLARFCLRPEPGYTRSSVRRSGIREALSPKPSPYPKSGIVASSIKPGSNAEQVQNGRMHQKEANSLHQDPQYEKQELKTALLLMSNGSSMHWVIKMVMKMDAAEPFNVPVDPVALAIPLWLIRRVKVVESTMKTVRVAAKLRILRVRVRVAAKSEKDLGRKDKDSKEKERVLEKKIHETEVTVDGEERQGKRGRENTGKEYLPDGRFIVSADRDFKIRVTVFPKKPLDGAHEIQSFCLGHTNPMRTFTLSNLGMFGVDRFDAILPLGQGAIMAARASKPTAIIGEILPSKACEENKKFPGNKLFKACEFTTYSRPLQSYFAAAVASWDADFYVKVDDDVHVNIATLGETLARYKKKPRVHIGCMKSGPVLAQKGVRYHELESWKFGEVGNS
ncbi:unnamed protein product [Camellia sinensis]